MIWKTVETLRAESSYYQPVDERFDGGPISVEDLHAGKRAGDPNAKARPMPFAKNIQTGQVNDPIAERKHFNTSFRRNPTRDDTQAAIDRYGSLPVTAATDGRTRALIDRASRERQKTLDAKRDLLAGVFRARRAAIAANAPDRATAAQATTTLEIQANHTLQTLGKIDAARAHAQAQTLITQNISIARQRVAAIFKDQIAAVRANTSDPQDAARKIVAIESRYEQTTLLLGRMLGASGSKQILVGRVADVIRRGEPDLANATQEAIMAQLAHELNRTSVSAPIQKAPPQTRRGNTATQAAIKTKQNLFTGFALSPGAGLPMQDLSQMIKLWQAVQQGRWPNGMAANHDDVELAKKQLDALTTIQNAWAGKDNKGLAASLPRAKPLSKVDPVMLSERDYQWSRDAVAMTQGADTWYQASRSHDPKVAEAMARAGLGSAGVTDKVETVIKRQASIDRHVLHTSIDLGGQQSSSIMLFVRPNEPNKVDKFGRRKPDYSHSSNHHLRARLVQTFLEQTDEGREIAKRYASHDEAIEDILLIAKYRAQMQGFYRPMPGSEIKGQGGKKQGLEAHLKYTPEYSSGDPNRPDSAKEARVMGKNKKGKPTERKASDGEPMYDRYIDPMDRPGVITDRHGAPAFANLGEELAQAARIIYHLNGIPVDQHGRPTVPFELDWEKVLKTVDDQKKTNYLELFQNLYSGPEMQHSIDRGFLSENPDDESGDSDLANMQATHFGKTGALSRSSAEYQGRLKAQHYDTAIWHLHKRSTPRLMRARLLDAMRVMMGTAEASGSARAKDLTEQVFGTHSLAGDERALLRGSHYSIDRSLIDLSNGLKERKTYGMGVDEFLGANAGASDLSGGVRDETIFRTNSRRMLVAKSGDPVDILESERMEAFTEANRENELRAMQSRSMRGHVHKEFVPYLKHSDPENPRSPLVPNDDPRFGNLSDPQNLERLMTKIASGRSGELFVLPSTQASVVSLEGDLYGGGANFTAAGEMFAALHPAARGVSSPFELHARLGISASEKISMESDPVLGTQEEYIDAALKVLPHDPQAARILRQMAKNIEDQRRDLQAAVANGKRVETPNEGFMGRPFLTRGSGAWRLFLQPNPLFSLFRREIDAGSWLGGPLRDDAPRVFGRGELDQQLAERYPIRPEALTPQLGLTQKQRVAARAAMLRKGRFSAADRLRASGGMKYLRDIQQQELTAVSNNPSSEHYSMLPGDFLSLWRQHSPLKADASGKIKGLDGQLHDARDIVSADHLPELFHQSFSGELVNWSRMAGLSPSDGGYVVDSLFQSGAFGRIFGEHLTYGMIARSAEDQRPSRPRFGETDESSYHRADRVVTGLHDYLYDLLAPGGKPNAKTLQYPVPTFGVQRDEHGELKPGRENARLAAWAEHVRDVRDEMGFMSRDLEDRVRNPKKYNQPMPLDRALKAFELQNSRYTMGRALLGARNFATNALRSPIGVTGDELTNLGLLVDLVPDEQHPGTFRKMTDDERFDALSMRREHQVEMHDFESFERTTPHLFNWLTGRSEKFHDAHLGATGQHAPPERRMLELGLAATAAFEAIASQHTGKLGGQDIRMHTNTESMTQFRARILDELGKVAQGDRDAWGGITMTQAMIWGERPLTSAKVGARRTVGLSGIATVSQAEELQVILPRTLDALHASHASGQPIALSQDLLERWAELLGWNYDKSAFSVPTEMGYMGIDPRNQGLPRHLIGNAEGDLEIFDPLRRDVQHDPIAVGKSTFPHLGDTGTSDRLAQTRVKKAGTYHTVVDANVDRTGVRWYGRDELDEIHKKIFDLSNPDSGLSRLLNPAPYDDGDGRMINLADKRFRMHGSLAEVMREQNASGPNVYAKPLGDVSPADRTRIREKAAQRRSATRRRVLMAQRDELLSGIQRAFREQGASPGAADYATQRMADAYGRSSLMLSMVRRAIPQSKALPTGPTKKGSVTYVPGKDIFQLGAQLLVNPTNLSDHTGAGLAETFNRRFPGLYEARKHAVQAGQITGEKSRSFDVGDGLFVWDLPTKAHFRDKAGSLELIDQQLAYLASRADKMKEKGITRVAIPMLGAGLGHLDWEQVQPLIDKHLSGIDGIDFLVTGPGPKPKGAHAGQASIDAMLFGLPSLFAKGKDAVVNWWREQQTLGVVHPRFRNLKGQFMHPVGGEMGLGLFGPEAPVGPMRDARGRFVGKKGAGDMGLGLFGPGGFPAQPPISGGAMKRSYAS